MDLREVAWPMPSGERWFDVRVAPLRDDGEVLGVHLVFADVTERVDLRTRLEKAHNELSTAYEELQSSSEELETTNEELQSAVEELETTNEELQSSNEELETMNEELQSTNEELQTLNDELRERTQQIDEVNGFLQSILEGLDHAVVVVDEDHRVQLWNSGAERLIGLRSFEVESRRLTDLELGFPQNDVLIALRETVVTGQPVPPLEVSLSDRLGRAQRRRLIMSPLRRASGQVTGAVVTIEDDPGQPSG